MLVVAKSYGAAGSFNDLFHIGKVGSGQNVELEVGDSASFIYNFASGRMDFYIGVNRSFYYNSAGQLHISNRDGVSDGGELVLDAAGLNETVTLENDAGRLKAYAGATLLFNAGTTTFDVDGNKITNLGTPTAATDAATMAYVDAATGSDHSLDSFDILKNKTIDNTNLIKATKHDTSIELGDDSIVGGDRDPLIDFHASNGVDFSSRIHRSSTVNGVWDFTQLGTGGVRLFTNSSIEFYKSGTYNGGFEGQGVLDIEHQNSIGSGAIIVMKKSPVNTKHAYMDNTSDEWRMHNGANEWLTIDLNNGAPYIHNLVGGGNVPHSCTIRNGFNGAGSFNANVFCAAGEIVTGGGCGLSSDNNPISSSYPIASNRWWCDRTSTTGSFNAWAVCCIY